MSVLAIDTSSRSRVVCVLATAGGELLDADVIRGAPVAASLPPALGRLLGAVETAIVVVTGPGTYTLLSQIETRGCPGDPILRRD